MLPVNFPPWAVHQLAQRRLVTDVHERVKVERLTCGQATIAWEKRPRDTTASIAIKNTNAATYAVNVRLIIASSLREDGCLEEPMTSCNKAEGICHNFVTNVLSPAVIRRYQSDT
jgi:hypothetical protein